jgi:hypothetical protein
MIDTYGTISSAETSNFWSCLYVPLTILQTMTAFGESWQIAFHMRMAKAVMGKNVCSSEAY